MLQPKIIDVKPLEDYFLLLKYETGEQKKFDVKPYIEGSWYMELKDKAVFNSVSVADGWTVEWQGGQDICPDELYYNSVELDYADKPRD